MTTETGDDYIVQYFQCGTWVDWNSFDTIEEAEERSEYARKHGSRGVKVPVRIMHEHTVTHITQTVVKEYPPT